MKRVFGMVALLCVASGPASTENLNQKYGPSWDCGYIVAQANYYNQCRVCEQQGQDFYLDWSQGQLGGPITGSGHCVPRNGAQQNQTPEPEDTPSYDENPPPTPKPTQTPAPKIGCVSRKSCGSGSICMKDGECLSKKSARYCGGGSYCPSGSVCMDDKKCLPTNSERYCGGKKFCKKGEYCVASEDKCYAVSSPRYCGNGQFCEKGQVCDRNMPEGSERCFEKGAMKGNSKKKKRTTYVALVATATGRFFGFDVSKSEAEAVKKAVALCRVRKANTATNQEEREEKCEYKISIDNGCVALSKSHDMYYGPSEDFAFGLGVGRSRKAAADDSFAICKEKGGKSCFLVPESIKCTDWVLEQKN